jgi:hypothetical protein
MLYFNNRLYIAFDSIFVSTDYGDHWFSINNGLTDTSITKLAVNDNFIFAATGSGVWRRSTDVIVKTPGVNNNTPCRFALHQNYPNPFNPATTINYELPVTNYVKLSVYDILGREITVLVNEQQQAGEYKVEWDASNYPSGVYFCKLITNEYSETKKMVLIK